MSTNTKQNFLTRKQEDLYRGKDPRKKERKKESDSRSGMMTKNNDQHLGIVDNNQHPGIVDGDC